MKASAVCSIVTPLFRNLNLLEYQSKGLLENYGVTVQKFKMAGNADEVRVFHYTIALGNAVCNISGNPKTWL